MTLELIKEEAKGVKPCNDLMLMTKDSTVILRDRVKDMSVVKFWETMKHKTEYKVMYGIATLSFPMLTHFVIDHGTTHKKVNGQMKILIRKLPKAFRKQRITEGVMDKYKPVSVVTSKTAATKIVSRCIHFGVHVFTKNVFQFLYGEPGDKKEIPKRQRTLTKFDVIALVFRPRTEAWSNEEAVDPNTLLLVSSFKKIDKHYQYTKKDLEDGDEEEDEGDTYGAALEEEHSRNMTHEFDNIAH